MQTAREEESIKQTGQQRADDPGKWMRAVLRQVGCPTYTRKLKKGKREKEEFLSSLQETSGDSANNLQVKDQSETCEV